LNSLFFPQFIRGSADDRRRCPEKNLLDIVETGRGCPSGRRTNRVEALKKNRAAAPPVVQPAQYVIVPPATGERWLEQTPTASWWPWPL